MRHRTRRPTEPDPLAQLGSGFQALYKCAPLGIATLSPTGRFLTSNAALQRMIGYDEGELAARSFDEVTHPQDVEACGVLFGRLQRGEIDNFEMDKRYVRKDGALIWAHVVVAAVCEDGALHHTVGVAVDITERKRAEEQLRKSEERHRALYRRTPAMMLSMDPEGRILDASDRWLSALGFEREDVAGRPFASFLAAESRRYFVEELLPGLRREGACTDLPLQLIAQNQAAADMQVSAIVELDPQDGTRRALAVLVDVTKRKRAEENYWKLTVELEERVRQRTGELEYQAALLAAEQDASRDGILVIGDDGERILSCSRRFAELWSLPADALESRALGSILPYCRTQLNDPEPFLAWARAAKARPEERGLVELSLTDDRTFEMFSSPVSGADGRLFGRVTYVHDVTRRARAERALRERPRA